MNVVHTGWNFWESAASFEPTEPDTPPPNRPRSALSNRMAISFPKPGGSNSNNIASQSSNAGVFQQQQQQQQRITYPPQVSALSHFADVSISELDINSDFTAKDYDSRQTYQQDDDNDSSDLEFEDDEEDDRKENLSRQEGENEGKEEEENNEEESHKFASIQEEEREKKLYVPTATSSSSKPFKIVPNTDNKASSFTMGRGRGMVKFGSSSPITPGAGNSKADSSSRRNVPVAKVTPTERSFGTVDDFNSMFDGQNNGRVTSVSSQSPSSNWRNRDNGDTNNSSRGDTVTSTSVDDENQQEYLSWRNDRKHNNNNHNNKIFSPVNNTQQYRATGENRSQGNNNVNRVYQDYNNRSSSNGSPNAGSPNNFSNKGHYNHHQQQHQHNKKRSKKNWRSLNSVQPNGGQYNTQNPPKIISGPPTTNKGHSGRFQASYQSKEAVIARPKAQRNPMVVSENESGSDSGGFGFGTTKPDMCFRCSSVDHKTEECTANNFFF